MGGLRCIAAGVGQWAHVVSRSCLHAVGWGGVFGKPLLGVLDLWEVLVGGAPCVEEVLVGDGCADVV